MRHTVSNEQNGSAMANTFSYLPHQKKCIWNWIYKFDFGNNFTAHNITIQGTHKRMVRFQKLTINLFLTLHGHNVHHQQSLEKTRHAWRVFSKPCTKLTLHCNHRSGHLKTEHTESLFLLRRHLGNWPRGPAVSMKSELLVAHEKLGQLPPLTVYVVPL